jgi:Zn-dependent protease/predicted transcriptional regulator
VRVHVSFLALVALVALGATAPAGPGLVPAMAWLVVLFACVVVHELAHSVVARRHGIPVREIELLPIGGVSKLGRMPSDPRVELRIAGAGPLASLGVAAVFALAATAAGVALWPPVLHDGALLARLMWVNLVLAGFNLLPAFPLDGGRMLRAALEARSDRASATASAARIGRALALAMIVGGLLFNLWLVLIGVFVLIVSRAEQRLAEVGDQLAAIRVRDVMDPAPAVLDEAPAAEVAPPLWSPGPRALPVVDRLGRPVGLVAVDDLASAPPGARVRDFMDPSVPTLDGQESLDISGLVTGTPPAAVVLERGAVVGVVEADHVATVVEQMVRARRSPAPRP